MARVRDLGQTKNEFALYIYIYIGYYGQFKI